ncbi:acetyl-CoA synthetase-like protein, partial [Anaeromyces robustus]
MNIYNIINNNHINKVLAISNFAFDISQTEITSSLVNGFTVVLMGDNIDDDVDLFVEKMNKNDIKLIKTTPTRFKLFLENKNFKNYLHKIKILIFGGEEFKLDLYHEIRKYSNCNIYNGYGPTECTVACTFTKVNIDEGKSNHNNNKITIGEPITNCPIYILDKFKKPVPIGVEGEIYIGGYGVGKGYLNREELTKEKFVDNPFNINHDQHNKIIYKTGDLGKWTMDGEVEYIGRMDFQVKINGQRIELGEIENTIKEINEIEHCVVIDKKKENGDQYLICYYITSTSNNDNLINGRMIRKHLNEKLPKYMIPNYYKRINEIPLSNSSGKLNRKALPEPTKEDFITEKYIAPETEMEKMICKFYSKIFNIPEGEIGRMSDFYELGGDSLNVIRFAALVENELNIKLHFKDIMSHSIISDLGKYIEKKLKDERIKENIINYSKDVEILDDPKHFTKEGLPTLKFPTKNDHPNL